MEVLLANSVALITAFLLVGIRKNKPNYNYATLFLMISLFLWLIVSFVWFYPLKGNVSYTLFFVDEFTYLFDYDYSSTFAFFVRHVTNLLGIEGYFFISTLFFSWSLLRIPYKYRIREKRSFVLILLIASSSYWSIFVLKEVLSLSGVLLFLFPGNKRKLSVLFLSIFLILISRPQLLLILLAAFVFNRLCVHQKLIVKLVCIAILFFLFINYLNSPLGQQLRMSILARAYGATNKAFTSEVFYLSTTKPITFLLSGLYRTAILTNIKETFLPKLNVAFPMYLMNILAVIFLIKGMSRKNFAWTYGFLLFIVSILTHSQIRYVLSGSIVLLILNLTDFRELEKR